MRVSQLFKGMLYHCVGGDVSDVINKTDCLNKGPPFRWINYKYNFDDLGQVCRRILMNWIRVMLAFVLVHVLKGFLRTKVKSLSWSWFFAFKSSPT